MRHVLLDNFYFLGVFYPGYHGHVKTTGRARCNVALTANGSAVELGVLSFDNEAFLAYYFFFVSLDEVKFVAFVEVA